MRQRGPKPEIGAVAFSQADVYAGNTKNLEEFSNDELVEHTQLELLDFLAEYGVVADRTSQFGALLFGEAIRMGYDDNQEASFRFEFDDETSYYIGYNFIDEQGKPIISVVKNEVLTMKEAKGLGIIATTLEIAANDDVQFKTSLMILGGSSHGDSELELEEMPFDEVPYLPWQAEQLMQASTKNKYLLLVAPDDSIILGKNSYSYFFDAISEPDGTFWKQVRASVVRDSLYDGLLFAKETMSALKHHQPTIIDVGDEYGDDFFGDDF